MNLVPKGRLNLVQESVLGWICKDDSVPQGRLKMGRDEILVQPSLRDLIMFHDVPRTNVLG
jgi:hypothetical protein